VEIRRESHRHVEIESNPSGQRCERPTMYAAMQHLVLSLIASVSVAYVGIFPYVASSYQDFLPNDLLLIIRSSHLTACILTCFGSLISVFDGISHEINPYLYVNPNQSQWFKTIWRKVSGQVLCTIVVVPIVSIVITYSMIRLDDSVSVAKYARLYFQLLRNCTCMSLYLFVFDEAIRTTLFFPRPDVFKLINQLNGDTTAVTRLGVILHTLFRDTHLVQQVVTASRSMPGDTSSYEMVELRSLERLMTENAKIILSNRSSNATLEVPLEQDVLRLIILEELGGGRNNAITRTPLALRHQRAINEWIDQPKLKRQQKLMAEPLSSTLVRGLCVYVGGNGAALTLLSSHKASTDRSCKFTLTAFCLLKLGAEAIARCMIRSLTSTSGRTLCDLRTAHLSLQLPSALQALFALRRGVVQYSKLVHHDYLRDSRIATDTTNNETYLTKEYGQVVRTCDTAALSILHSLKDVQLLSRINIALDKDCQEWQNRLLAQIKE
jgi:hypothetical protein